MLDHRHYVIDASFLGRLIGLLGSEEQTNAFDHIQNATLHAPILIKYEIGNVFLKYPFLNADELYSLMNMLAITYSQNIPLTTIYQVAQQNKLTFYDASYLVVLLEENMDGFLTCDKDFKHIKNQKIKIIL